MTDENELSQACDNADEEEAQARKRHRLEGLRELRRQLHRFEASDCDRVVIRTTERRISLRHDDKGLKVELELTWPLYLLQVGTADTYNCKREVLRVISQEIRRIGGAT
jgi:hypothetical protein